MTDDTPVVSFLKYPGHSALVGSEPWKIICNGIAIATFQPRAAYELAGVVLVDFDNPPLKFYQQSE